MIDPDTKSAMLKMYKKILLEVAGKASMCWEPQPSGDFKMDSAMAAVDDAMKEIDTLYDISVSQGRMNYGR